jgi:hypothetical protein
MVACVVVPILANGVRAWGTILPRSISAIEAAAGFDHIIYGWVFFAIVIALILAGAWRDVLRPPLRRAPVDASGAIIASPLLGRLEGLAHCGRWRRLPRWRPSRWGRKCWARPPTVWPTLPPRIDLPQVAGLAADRLRPPGLVGTARRRVPRHRLLGRYAATCRQRGRRVHRALSRAGRRTRAGRLRPGRAGAAKAAWDWQAPGPTSWAARATGCCAEGRGAPSRRDLVSQRRDADRQQRPLKLATMQDKICLLRARPPYAMLILTAEQRATHPAERSPSGLSHARPARSMRGWTAWPACASERPMCGLPEYSI